LGSGTLVSIREIVEQLASLVESQVRPVFGALPPRPIEPVRAANTSDAYDKLGWRAVTPLDRGLEKTVEWYRAQPQSVDAVVRIGTATVEGNESTEYGRLESRSRS
jgi:nucleoside-diphosphate-sugar epimerase